MVKTLRTHHPAAPDPGPPSSPVPDRRPEPRRNSPAAGHTALPTRREIACPDCGWESFVMGRQFCAVCPKCRKKIDIVDHTLDIDFAGTIRTAGMVRLTESAVLLGGEIRAAVVRLAAPVRGGRIVAWNRLIVAGCLRLPLASVEFRDLELAAGARLDFDGPVSCRSVEVAGEVSGSLEATSRITVRAGGMLRGRVVSPVLVVEDGGGLDAEVRIGEAAAE